MPGVWVVGLRVARVAGGMPSPELRVSAGPPVVDWRMADQEMMASPLPALMVAVTGVSVVTMVPLAGETSLTLGGCVPLDVATGGACQVRVVVLEKVRRPSMRAVPVAVSVPGSLGV